MLLNQKTKLDFYNMINDDQKETFETDIDNLCKITDDQLEDNYIELSCGHKFNYLALYNEIKYQKTNRYALSYDYTKLNINQIKCPYCRSITNNILPYFKYYNVDMIRGVTFPFKYCMKIHSCQHILKSSNRVCNSPACKTPYGIYCNKHYNSSINKKSEYKSLEERTVIELKNILRKNSCKISGKKSILIDRIKNEKNNNPNWLD